MVTFEGLSLIWVVFIQFSFVVFSGLKDEMALGERHDVPYIPFHFIFILAAMCHFDWHYTYPNLYTSFFLWQL